MSAVGTLPRESLAEGLRPRTIDELRAFVGLAPKQTVNISISINDMFERITLATDSLLLKAIEKRTAVEFAATTADSFNDYVRVLRAKADLLKVILRDNRQLTERLVNESLVELEADFNEHGLQRFGMSLTNQAIFTVWTLRKTAPLI